MILENDGGPLRVPLFWGRGPKREEREEGEGPIFSHLGYFF